MITAAAGTGIGSATARRCLEEGARVVVSDQHERRLAGPAPSCAGAGAPRRRAALRRDRRGAGPGADRRGRRALGRIDVMVNNAGLGGTGPILDMTDEQWLRSSTSPSTAPSADPGRAAPDGRPGRRGAVVNNASVLGWRAQPGQAHYAAAKAGVMALTRCAAIESPRRHPGQRGRAQPGHPSLPGQGDQRGPARRADRPRAFGRAAEPWEVANVIVFLASDYASYLTGEVVSVSAQHP